MFALVSEPGFLLGFGSFPWKSNSFTRNEPQEQHSLLDTIFNYICLFWSSDEAGRHVVGLEDLNIHPPTI